MTISASGFDLTPPTAEERARLEATPQRGRAPRAAASRHRGAVLRRAAQSEEVRRLLLPALRPAALSPGHEVRKRHRLAELHRRRSTPSTSSASRTMPTACAASRPAARAATATRATSSRTARAPTGAALLHQFGVAELRAGRRSPARSAWPLGASRRLVARLLQLLDQPVEVAPHGVRDHVVGFRASGTC